MPTHDPDPAPDPGNTEPDGWTAEFDPAELEALLAEVDDPSDPLVLAGLAGTLYDDPALNAPATTGGDGNGR